MSFQGLIAPSPKIVFDVREYGAVASYSTDSTTAIQAALDAAGAAGGIVFFPPGVFKVTNTLLVPSYVTVYGSGRGATIIRSPAGDYAGKSVNGLLVYSTFAMIAVSNAEVRSLTVDHATYGTTCKGISIDIDGLGNYSTDCVVEDTAVSFSDNSNYCIWSRKARGSRILFNYVDGGQTVQNAGGTQEGIEVYGGQNVLVLGNTVSNIGNSGIYVNPEPTYSGPASDINIIGNYVTNCQWGVNVVPGDTTSRVKVKDNFVLSTWVAGIQATSGGAIVLEDVQIDGNTIKTSPIPIRLYGQGGTMRKIAIRDNTVEGASDAANGGISLTYTTNAKVHGNIVRTSSGDGFYIINSSDIDVQGNTVNGAQKAGVHGDTCDRIRISSNELLDWNGGGGGNGVGNGIYLATVTDALVTGNRFNRTTTTGTPYAIYAVGSCSKVTMAGNVLLYAPDQNPEYRNSGSNPNIGTFTASSTSITITNSLANASSVITLQQTGGAAVLGIKTITTTSGSFTVTFTGTAAGDETFKYQIGG